MADLRLQARRRLPRVLFDLVDGAAFSETTHANNASSFDEFYLQQRALRGVAEVDLSTTLFGKDMAMPLALAPIGLAGVLAPRGEVQAARAAAAESIPACLSTFSICSIEEVAARAVAPWLQLYIMRDRTIAERLLERAAAVGTDVLVLTVDSSVGSIRERDVRNGLAGSSGIGWRNLVDMACHPRWVLGHARAPRLTMGNMAPSFAGNPSLLQQMQEISRGLDPTIDWEVLRWLRAGWPGTLLVKGILTADDARRAADAGADGLVVSNHGGRQLDGAPPTLYALPQIRAAVGPNTPILLDGGITRGVHAIKAIGLGADAVLIGRAYAFALAAGGAKGVRAALTLLRREMEISLSLMGVRTIRQLKAEAGELVFNRSKLLWPGRAIEPQLGQRGA